LCTGCAHVTSGGTHCHDDTEDAAPWAAHATQELCESHDDDHHWCRSGFEHTALKTCSEVSGYDYAAECVAPLTGNCAGSKVVNKMGDAASISSCTVIGGDLTIQSSTTTSVTAAVLDKLKNLEKVCGNVKIENIDAQTLDGLQNLAFVGGNLDIQNNAYYGTDKYNFLKTLAGLGVQYVGGNIGIATNYYLEDLGGFGPVTLGGNWARTLHPGCPTVCTGAGSYSSMFTNCANLCSSATSYYDYSAGTPGAATSAAECAGNPYSTAPPTPRPTPQPTPSPVVDTGVPNCRDLCDAFHAVHGNTNPWCASCNSATTNCFTGGGSCGTYGAGICTGSLGGQVCQP